MFRAVWARVRQFWTAEMWVRVTDDERNVKWLGLNVDPMTMQAIALKAQQDPEGAQQSVAGIVGSIAELDCDSSSTTRRTASRRRSRNSRAWSN